MDCEPQVVVDIATKTEFDPGGNLDLYGGAWSTFSPSIEYGSSAGQTQYFVTGRYLQSAQGLENADPTQNPIHDRTTQEKFFGYGSTLLGDSSRLTYMSGASSANSRSRTSSARRRSGTLARRTMSSASLNENETDRFYFGVLALQTHHEQRRYAALDLHALCERRFSARSNDDLAFNDVASNVVRKSLESGLNSTLADRLGDAQALRAGVASASNRPRSPTLQRCCRWAADGVPLA